MNTRPPKPIVGIMAHSKRISEIVHRPLLVMNILEKLNGYARIASHAHSDSWFSSTDLIMSITGFDLRSYVA